MAANRLGLTILGQERYQIQGILSDNPYGVSYIAQKLDDQQRKIQGKRVALQKSKILKRLNDEKKPLNTSEIAFIMLQLLEGLEYIHNSGFIHRDISPDNLFVFNDGIIKIGKFDIATFGNKDQISPGKRLYMAPEIQIYYKEFPSPSPIDNSVDIWSLGILFYYLMMGKVTLDYERFNEQSINKLIQQKKLEVQLPEQYSQFQEIFNKMTKIQPNLRPTIEELKGEFLRLIQDRQQYNKYQCYAMNYYFNQVKLSVGNSMQQLKKYAEFHFQNKQLQTSILMQTYQPANISLKIRDSFDGYQILDQIAHGLNASVFKAKDLKNNKNVAFKQQDLSILNFRKGEDLSNEVLRIMREISNFSTQASKYC
ncbi:UNKNOWN [Stylonychia lemnae]|uniref:Protein kinase domain-containing protein n=1 Tax=Stylonychia lemnae TaxID=5949 RepID=A0A077ZWQ4_STYLE|nr:UNKNOWN [Stylonychia lemnae]|eukprot:CDW74026.1 UNKNOWN [Stylonychia lemnae]